MASLFASINASSQSLTAYQRALQITQNNVDNASTPGYSAQTVDFTSLSFDSQSGLAGGVAVSSSSTRDTHLDSAVRSQLNNLGTAQQQVSNLGGVEGLFDVSGASGIPAALTSLFNKFSDLSVAPASSSSRQAVVSAATDVATAFNQISSSFTQAGADAGRQIQAQVAQINALSAEIQGYNVSQQQSGTSDAGRDAKLENALEKLSSLANISTRPGANGGTDVLLGGQIPLVLGAQQYSLSAALAPLPTTAPPNPNGTPPEQILDSNGNDITSRVSGGSLAGLLQFRNTTLPSLQGDRNQVGSLNTLAKSFADRINSLLTSGVISEGPPVQPGVPIFTYSATDPTKTAASLSVVSGFTPDQIATISSGPPSVSNGIALAVAAVGKGATAADQVNGFSFTQFFGEIAGGIGKQLATQKSAADLGQQAVTQAQSLRSQFSGVSLDAEAVKLTEFQKAYSAAAKLINVLDQIAQSALGILTSV